MLTNDHVDVWMKELKLAWESGNVEGALKLFSKTSKYYERPFSAGTTMSDIRGYWTDIVHLHDIRFEYKIAAIDKQLACIMWDNWFRTKEDSVELHLNGVFLIEFDVDGNCIEFRQWWFQE